MMKKVIILGSGAIKIGQAGEFDYSGSQAIKALKEEGIKTILINPNIATIQTSDYLADKVYFIPVEPNFVEDVIKKEKPDGIMLAFGGQTALNCGVELEKQGILSKYNLEVLGTPVKAIEETEDRELFVKKLKEIGLKTPRGIAVKTVKDALKASEEIGFPVMSRAAYTLGGLGSGIARNKEKLKKMVNEALSKSPQVLIEEWIGGWKEVEYEVIRDKYDNCVTVCNMENFDPMGIHTGESIVVAPSQTLSNSEYHKLRDIAIRLIRHIGIVGECNIQYALDPETEDYRIIEVNARLSRSSALASKATGYPLAFIAAKLGLGYSLTEVKNSITKVTAACFEPALDYCVVKIPRWDLKKFKKVSKVIGSEMKSVGEIMAIGRKFEEALQKAIRMLSIGMEGAVCNDLDIDDIEEELNNPTDMRVYAIAKALEKGMTVEKIHSLSKIDLWFLNKIKNIVEIKKEISKHNINNLKIALLKEAKQLGFSDKQIAKTIKADEIAVRRLRKRMGLMPYVKQIDTLGAEYPAKTNYLYLTYNGSRDDIEVGEENQVAVLGSGAYRIGSSVEFDWCCVNSVLTLRKLGYKTIMINYNPETVSTDYDICDKLYFDELSFETVMDIYEKEKIFGLIISVGGQIPNNLAMPLHNLGVNILGTSPKSIDNAEDRNKFSKLLDELEIDQPEWEELTNINEAKKFAAKVKYPVLVRPSYVLSGAAMAVVNNDKDLEKFLKKAAAVSKEHPVVISNFIEDAREIELDAVANKGKIVCYAISEHVENAGVHSGDATMVLPPQRTYLETTRRIKKIGTAIAQALNISGPFNIQFIAKENYVKVIECNLRASRSFPFCSKVFKLNFIELATKSIMGRETPKIDKSVFELDYVGVKAPQFSFTRLKGADPILGVEMASTGEVACLGDDLNEAFLKAYISAGWKIPKKKKVLLSTGPLKSKAEFLMSAKKMFDMGYELFATKGTYDFLKANKVKCTKLFWPSDKKNPNVIDYLSNGKIDLVINIPKSREEMELTNDYMIRRTAVDFNITLITDIKVAKRFIDAIFEIDILGVKSWDEYN